MTAKQRSKSISSRKTKLSLIAKLRGSKHAKKTANKTKSNHLIEKAKKSLDEKRQARAQERAKLTSRLARANKLTAPPFEILDVAAMVEVGDFIPQAIVRHPIEALAKKFHAKLSEGTDDFDSYKGLAFKLDDVLFTVMHYEGHPKGTATIYLLDDLVSVPTITRTIDRITKHLGIPASELAWQRKDDPDL